MAGIEERAATSAIRRAVVRAWRSVRTALRPAPDDRWAAVFGRVAVYSFAVAVVTGFLLLPSFQPDMTGVVYHGSYRPLDGVHVSKAFRSVLEISFDERGGLLVRQVHHWSSLVFVAAICLRLLRLFFRGRFAGRALPGWLIWVTLLPVGMMVAYTGTLLPDDMVSGGSLSVITGVLLSVPVIGTRLVFWIFGGAPPGHLIVGRDYWVHILVLPALAGVLLLATWPAMRWRRRTRPSRRGLDPLLPVTFGVLVLLGTVAQISPVWLYGPYEPGTISSGAVPDWYMAFLDGPLRLMPAWQVWIAGHSVELGVLVPGLILPGLFFTGVALYPMADRWITGERRPRLLRRLLPVDPAIRTAAGVAGITFYGLLWAAAANDQIAFHFHLDLNAVTWAFRVLVLAGPVLAFVVTRGVWHGLAERRRDEEAHGVETGKIVRNPQGGYTEIRRPLYRTTLPSSVDRPSAAPAAMGTSRRVPRRRPGRSTRPRPPVRTTARPTGRGGGRTP